MEVGLRDVIEKYSLMSERLVWYKFDHEIRKKSLDLGEVMPLKQTVEKIKV